MATITNNGNLITIGIDFVDSVTKAKSSPVCKGTLELIDNNEMTIKSKQAYRWQSTLNITDTEHVIRQSIKTASLKLSSLVSQNC